MSKKFKIINYIILGISVLAILQFFIADFGFLQDGEKTIQKMEPDEKVLAVGVLAQDWGALIFKYTIGLLVLCTIGVIGFSLYNFVLTAIDKPKKAIRTGIVALGICAIIFIAYSIASDAIPPIIGSDIEVTHSLAKWVDTGLWVMYITFGLTILSVCVGEVSRIFK
jgi:hypothetical protein